jgi:hypothetical protein
MKSVLSAAVVLSLVVAAWAIAGSRPAVSTYTVEVRDVAGAESFVVTPDVAVTATGHLVMPEVVVSANMMAEVVVRPSAVPSVAHVRGLGPEALD